MVLHFRPVRISAAAMIASVGFLGCENASPLCARCNVELEAVTTLRPVAPTVDFVMRTRIAYSDGGNFYAGPLAISSLAAVFSGSGDLLRTVGKAGTGPGEFQRIEDLHVIGGDSLLVVDGSAKAEVFDNALENVRMFRTLGLPMALRESLGGGFVVNIMMDERTSSSPLWVIDRAGERVTELQTQVDDVQGWIRRIAVASDGRIWAISQNYLVEAFQPDGSRLVHWRGNFAPLERYGKYHGYVKDISISGSYLLVLLSGRNQRWKPTATSDGSSPGGRPMMLSVEEAAQLHKYSLDVIDLNQQKLIAREDLPGMVAGGFTENGFLFSYHADRESDLFIRLWRVRIDQPQER
jgi:hypothetical protein